MNHSKPVSGVHGQATISRGFNWRMFLLLILGIAIAVAGLLVFRIVTDEPPAPPIRSDSIEPAPPVKVVVDVAAVREEAWQRIEPRLEQADQKTQELTNQFVQQIEEFFEDRKAGAAPFAGAALGWTSKWELIMSRAGHREFIAARFSEYIFSEDQMSAMLRNATEEYVQGLKAVKNELLVQVRVDLQDMPSIALPAFVNEQQLQLRFAQIIEGVMAGVAKDLKVDVGREIGSLLIETLIAAVVTDTLTAMATRMGVSGAVLGAGAASSWATFGAGILIGIAVDALLGWMIEWFYDPTEEITSKIAASLNEVKQLIIAGDPEAWQIREIATKLAESHVAPEVRAKAAKVVDNITRGGALGLKHTLGRLAEVQSRSRQLTFKQLVLQETP